MRAPSGTCAAPTWDGRTSTAPQGFGHRAWEEEKKLLRLTARWGWPCRTTAGGHGRYDLTAGAAPQGPTLAADAPSFINDISGIIKHIPQFDGEGDHDESEDELGRRCKALSSPMAMGPMASCCFLLRIVWAYLTRLGHRESICMSQDMRKGAAEGCFVLRYLKLPTSKCVLYSRDGHGQQLHAVGAVATISAGLGHRESICTSSAICG